MNHNDTSDHGQVGWGHLLQSLIDALPDPIFIKDSQHRWVACNAAFCDLIGQPHDQLIGHSDQDYWPRAQAEVFLRADDLVMQSGTPYAQEEVATGSNNVPRTIWTRKFALRDPQGHIIGLCGIITDITDLQQRQTRVAQLEEDIQARLVLLETQEALGAALARERRLLYTHGQLEYELATRRQDASMLRDREAWFRSLAGNSLDLIAIVDLVQLKVVYINHDTWLGYPACDLVQLDGLDQAVHPDDRPALAAYRGRIVRSALSVVQRIEYRLQHPRGDWEWVQSRATPFLNAPTSRPTQVLLTLTTVTEYKRMEAALRASEERYRLIAETATDAMVSINEANTIVFVNRAATRIFGYQLNEMFGHSLMMLMPPAMRHGHRHGMQRYLATGVRHLTWEGVEITGLHKNGHEIPLQVSFGEYHAGDTRVFTAIMRDMTAHKQLAAQLLHAQKLESVGRLAGGIAHDFNNLLTVIIGFAGLALDALPADAALRYDINAIQDAAQGASRLTRQLLSFARRQVIEPRVLNLNDLLSTMLPLLRRVVGETIELVVLTDVELRPIKADPGQIEQVLMNLVVNAHDAMPGGGRLELVTTNVVSQRNQLGLYGTLVPGPSVQLLVRDTGHGMDATVQQHVFEPFFTTKEPGKGTGLGLATCYGIITQHGGHIDVQSAVGAGTTISISFPPCNEPATPAPQPAFGSLPTGTETILLVEDAPAVRQLAAQVLRKHHYTVLEATNGVDAIQLLAAHRPRTVQLLITDVMMPQMGGEALAAHLTTDDPTLRVLFMSGYIDHPFAPEQHDATVAWLAKPFSPAALARKVREVLDAATAQPREG